jgi:hypothetical protein
MRVRTLEVVNKTHNKSPLPMDVVGCDILRCGAVEAQSLAERCGLTVNVFEKSGDGAAVTSEAFLAVKEAGLNKFNAVDPQFESAWFWFQTPERRVESAWFQLKPLNLSNEKPVSKFAFHRNLYCCKEAAFVQPTAEWTSRRSDVVEKKSPSIKSGFFRWEALITGRVGC